MFYLLIGGVILGYLLFGPGRRILKLPTWRIGSAVGAIMAFAAAAFFLMRNNFPIGIGAVLLGLWLAVSARMPRLDAKPRPRPEPSGGMSLTEARAILGVEAGATAAEVKTAYTRLMQRVHPDKDGTAGLAAQLNAARDRLLKG